MPIYQYKVIDSKFNNEVVEIEQSIGDEELNEHPITGEPIKRLISLASLTLKHATSSENASLESDQLAKKGFTLFEKDSSQSSKYTRSIGKFGPSEIDLNKLSDE